MKTVTQDIRILKIGSCESVSRKSTLTYHVGCRADGEIHLRIYANTAAGFFSQEWLPLKEINQVLSMAGGHFTSFALQSLFRGKSQNNTAFLLAVLQSEGLVARAIDKKRCYDKLDAGPFIAEIKALIGSNTSLNANDKPSKPAKTSDDKPEKKETANKVKVTSKKATSMESGEQDSPS
jgi:hypothetical protein